MGDLQEGDDLNNRASEADKASPKLAVVRGHDAVESPHHYARLDPQPLDIIEAWGLDYHRGNALKYLARAGFKVLPGQTKAEAESQDLRKAAAYLLRLADTIEEDGS